MILYLFIGNVNFDESQSAMISSPRISADNIASSHILMKAYSPSQNKHGNEMYGNDQISLIVESR